MKKNTLRKLTLSAVTLGVAALSLTSTTYAWFTTNGSATASGISGTVSSPDLLMLIKSPTGWDTSSLNTPIYNGTYTWDDNNTSATTFSTTESSNAKAATFQTSTKLVNENGNGGNRDKLSPVSIASSELTANTKNIKTVSFKKLDDSKHTEGNETSAESYLHYQVVISVSGLEADKTYDVNMVLPEINNTPVEQYLLVDAGSDAKAGSTIKVSLADALSLGIKNTIIDNNGSTYGVTKGGTVTNIATDNGGFYHAVAEVDTLTIKSLSDETGKKGDAITYYKNVYGLEKFEKSSNYDNLYTTGDNQYFSAWNNNTSKTIYSIKTTGNATGSFVCVTDLYFFIDGWDYQCFNAIGGQSVFATTNVEQSITFTCKEHTN